MNKKTYSIIEKYMLNKMKDSAHDYLHIYRVLYRALEISCNYDDINKDVLIASCLLHDIGRQAQFDNPSLCHAKEGGKMAYEFLKEIGWKEKECIHVQDCISSHRFRVDNPPKTIEAKILFDSDKLDVTGALGIARSLIYKGQVGEPIYTIDKNNKVQDGSEEDAPESFFKEYHYKLKKLYNHFYTEEARNIAQTREMMTISFYDELLAEVDIDGLKELLGI